MKRAATILLLPLALGALSLQGFAQNLGSERKVKAQGYVSADGVRPGDKFKVAVAIEVARGYHINASVPSFAEGIGTAAILTPLSGIRFDKPEYPPADRKKFGFAPNTPLDVYEGLVPVVFGADAAPHLDLGSTAIEGTVTVQACNEESCLAPAHIRLSIPIKVIAPGTPVQLASPEIFSGLRQFHGAQPDSLADLIASGGMPFALLTVFLAGLALNLTPCVYPIIPITIGFFANPPSAGKRRMGQTFAMAATYVFGMAITYSLLGVLASMTGGLFGAALQSPVVLIGLAGVMVALSLSMFGIYDFRVPGFLNRLSSQGTRSASGVIGALIMGLTMGLVAAPCVGPFVVGLLVHVGAAADPVYGFFIFFVFALGLGLPYVFLGAFSGTIKELPRSGEWMVAIRRLFGVVLVGMALYFLMPLMGTYTQPILATFFAVAALYLILWESGRARTRAFAWVLRTIGAVAIAGAIFMGMPEKEGIAWQPYSEEALIAAMNEGRPVVIDVFADWCIPCKELDHRTFTDDEVKREASKFVTLKLNVTAVEDLARRAREKHDIAGVPTVIFLDAAGSERKGLRLMTFEKPENFLGRLKRVLSGPSSTK